MSRYKRRQTLVCTAYPKLEVLEREQPKVFTAIKKFKGVRDDTLLTYFGLKLKSLVEEKYGRNFDAVTCPPIKKKRIEKGYSPAAELGKRVSAYLGIDYVSFFEDGGGIYPERYKTAAKRFREGKFFRPEMKTSPQGLKILLIDDVTITNLTLVISTEALYRWGAGLVRCIALAG